jgi:hypothetical protein
MIRYGKCGCNWQTQLQEPSAGRSASRHPDGVSRIRATLPTSSDVTKFELSGAVPSRAGRGPQLPASEGSALGFSQAQSAFLERVKGGHFDDLLQRCCPVRRAATPAMNTGPVPRERALGDLGGSADKAAGGGLRHALDLLAAGTAQGLVAGDLSRLVDGSASPRHPSTRGKRPQEGTGPAKFANRELFDRNGTT